METERIAYRRRAVFPTWRPLADAGPDHRHEEATDPRWAALRQLGDQASNNHQDRRAGAIDLQEG